MHVLVACVFAAPLRFLFPNVAAAPLLLCLHPYPYYPYPTRFFLNFSLKQINISQNIGFEIIHHIPWYCQRFQDTSRYSKTFRDISRSSKRSLARSNISICLNLSWNLKENIRNIRNILLTWFSRYFENFPDISIIFKIFQEVSRAFKILWGFFARF